MKCRWNLVALALLPLIHGMWTEGPEVSGSLSTVEFQHRAILDQMGNFIMLWTPLEKEIHIEIQVATTGFIGLGFSPNGGMKGADIVLAWVDDLTGELRVHDRFAHGNMVPVIDDVQDITVVGGYQNDSHTVLRFSRPWNTCDDVHDIKLSGDTTRVIWAYSYEDPFGDMAMSQHDQRGSKSIYLSEPRFNLPTFSEDVKSIDFLSSQVRLPDDLDTVYWCQIYRIPDLVSKNHMIGYVPVTQEGNEEQVHHILLNECHLNESSFHYEQWLTAGGRQCLTANMPRSWYFCSHTIIAWAIGSEGDLYPEHVGMPIGEEYGGSNFYMMQVHYDNPKLKKGVVDNSGLRIFYTDKPREIDGGVIMVGSAVTPTMIIPPRQKWNTVGVCPGECTEKGFPEGGIKVFQGLLHAHLLGRAITVKQIRNGRELPTVFKDMNYDFNYQQQRILKEDMVILPGDTLIVECTHDSIKKAKTTFGGEGTNDEMCLAYLTYYPRVELSACLSQPQLPTMYEPLGVQDIYNKEKVSKTFGGFHKGGMDGPDANTIKAMDKKFLLNPSGDFEEFDISLALKRVVLKNPYEYQNRTLYDLVHDANTWKDPKVLAELQDNVNYGSHSSACTRTNDKSIEGVSGTVRYPDFITFKPIVEDECVAASQPEEIFVAYEGPKTTQSKSFEGSPKIPEPQDNQLNQANPDAAAGSSTILSPSVLIVCVYLLCQTFAQ